MNAVWILVASLVFDVLLVGALFWKMPDWSRPEMLFGVTVPADVRRGRLGAALIERYRRRVAFVTAIAFVIAWSPLVFAEQIASSTMLVTLLIVGQLVAVAAAFLSARRDAVPLAVAPSAHRVASLTTSRETMPGGWFWQTGPFALFAALLAALVWAWPEIPERFITHWNGSFEPDGWSEKGIATVFGLPAIGIATCAMFPPIAWSLLHRTRRVHVEGEAGRAESARRRAVVVLLLWLEYLMVAIFAPLALTPFAQSPATARALTFGVLLLAIAGPIAMLLIWFIRYGSVVTERTRGAEASVAGAPIGDRTHDRHWKWGVIYYNPDDPVLWVEKRFGVGYTFNMARPSAWWILGAMIGVPLALTVVIAVAS